MKNSNEPLRIGIYKNLAGELVDPMNGQMDEMRLWSTARTAQQIQDHYSRALTGSETGLIAYYTFNSCVSGSMNQVVNDAATGSELDGTMSLVNAPLVVNACETLLDWNAGVEEFFGNTNRDELIVDLYPNPGIETSVVLNNFLEVSEIEINDLNGKVIYSVVPESNTVVINSTVISNGVYCIRAKGKNGDVEARKWIKSDN